MYAVVTVDLKGNVTDQKRTKFNDAMDTLGWTKERGLTTTWTASFQAGATASRVRATAIAEVKKSAVHAGISIGEVSAIALAGDEGPSRL